MATFVSHGKFMSPQDVDEQQTFMVSQIVRPQSLRDASIATHSRVVNYPILVSSYFNSIG